MCVARSLASLGTVVITSKVDAQEKSRARSTDEGAYGHAYAHGAFDRRIANRASLGPSRTNCDGVEPSFYRCGTLGRTFHAFLVSSWSRSRWPPAHGCHWLDSFDDPAPRPTSRESPMTIHRANTLQLTAVGLILTGFGAVACGGDSGDSEEDGVGGSEQVAVGGKASTVPGSIGTGGAVVSRGGATATTYNSGKGGYQSNTTNRFNAAGANSSTGAGASTGAVGGLPNRNTGGFSGIGIAGLPNLNFGGLPNINVGGLPNLGLGGLPNLSFGGVPNLSFGGLPNIGSVTMGGATTIDFEPCASGVSDGNDCDASTVAACAPSGGTACVCNPLSSKWICL